jgi:hypothetical protein
MRHRRYFLLPALLPLLAPCLLHRGQGDPHRHKRRLLHPVRRLQLSHGSLHHLQAREDEAFLPGRVRKDPSDSDQAQGGGQGLHFLGPRVFQQLEAFVRAWIAGAGERRRRVVRAMLVRRGGFFIGATPPRPAARDALLS